MYVSYADVRAAFLVRQGLAPAAAWHSVHEAISQIGAVQIDTIAVVARSHHLTLRARVQRYDPERLWAALRRRALFEYYVHGNSFIPIEDFPYVRHCMQRFPTHGYNWLRKAMPRYRDLMETIRQRIQNEGPLTSRDFQDPKHHSRGWWDWKPAKNALELLWWTGQIVVVDRVGFQRVYDVAERGVPSKYLDRHVESEEVWRFYLKRAVDCLAVATISDIQNYFNFHIFALDRRGSRRKALMKKMQILQQEDTVSEVEAEDQSTPHYVLSDNLAFMEDVQNHEASRNQALFLSPFDNLVWDRRRVRRLFGSEVKLEAYIPAARRTFGYFAMPILWKNRIIGRLDPKADRKSSTLTLANLELTVAKKEYKDAVDATRAELAAFKAFHGCEQLKIQRSKPARLKDCLS